jgi:hypothetical protein
MLKGKPFEKISLDIIPNPYASNSSIGYSIPSGKYVAEALATF